MRLHKDVQQLITTHGYEVSFSRAQSGGSYDTATGTITGGTTLTWTGRGVFINYMDEDVNGTSITTDDRKLLLQAVGLTRAPEINDLIAVGTAFEDFVVSNGSTFTTSDGETYQVLSPTALVYDVAVIDVRKIQSGNTVIAYICQTRG